MMSEPRLALGIILTVEDDERLNRIVCTYLNDSGFQTKRCLNAQEAYDEMYDQLYDLRYSDRVGFGHRLRYEQGECTAYFR